ncbi:MAG: thiamine pyrophosphate-dependent enzyme [Ilumatobacteraceae bacterium]
MALTGGSIGFACPAPGAAVACPDRKVVCLTGDGGGMYTLQALWTMARERLDVTTVVFSNRAYAILKVELVRTGALDSVATRLPLMDLDDPNLDWVKLAEGMGVSAVQVDTVESFSCEFAASMAANGPRLIEVTL